MATKLNLGIEYFNDPETGKPLASGQVYIGQVDLDPSVLANRVSVTLVQEDGTSVAIAPSAQPLTIGAGGRIMYSGSPVAVTVDGAYSVKVTDSLGSQIYYVPSNSQPESDPEDTGILVLNGSFENQNATTGLPDNWTLNIGENGDIAIDSADSAHGLNSLKFTGTDATGGGTAVSSTFDVLKGGNLYVEFTYKSSSVNTLNKVQVKYYNSLSAVVSTDTIHSEGAANPTSYRTYIKRSSVPATAVQAVLVLTGVDGSGTTVIGITNFDNISASSLVLGDFVTPQMYGALGDGATDDTAAIQVAFDTGRDVYFNKAGTYLCIDARPVSNQKIIFTPGAILKQPDDSSVSGSGVLTLSAVSNVQIINPQIDGNAANNTSVAGSRWPWNGIVVSSASTDCKIEGGHIYDCFVDNATYPDGQCCDIYIRADSRRISVKGTRLGKSNNNLILQDAYYCAVSDVIFEDNISSEALSLFNTTTSRDIWNHHTVSDIISDNCRQALSIANSAGNTVSGIIVDNWRDSAITVRTGGNTVSNVVVRAGENTGVAIATHESIDGRFPVTCDEFNSSVTADGLMSNFIVDIAGWYPASTSNCYQLTNKNFKYSNMAAINSVMTRENSTAYSLNEYVVPAHFDGVVFKCTTAGTTAASEPTMSYTAGNRTQGATTTDGTVVWTAQDVPDVSGINLNGAENIDLENPKAKKMPTSGIKVNASCKNINIINGECDRNWEYGLLVGAGGLQFGKISGGSYTNNSLDRASKAGVLVADAGNYGIMIDVDLMTYDDQVTPTQNNAGLSPGSGAANITTASTPPTKGLWRLGQRAYRRNPTATLSGWYVFGRDDTTVNATEAAGQTVITVADISGITDGDSVGIMLDSGEWHWSTINGSPAGTEITITDALPSQASTGSRVVTTQWVDF